MTLSLTEMSSGRDSWRQVIEWLTKQKALWLLSSSQEVRYIQLTMMGHLLPALEDRVIDKEDVEWQLCWWWMHKRVQLKVHEMQFRVWINETFARYPNKGEVWCLLPGSATVRGRVDHTFSFLQNTDGPLYHQPHLARNLGATSSSANTWSPEWTR
jgi:hypothetical protein